MSISIATLFENISLTSSTTAVLVVDIQYDFIEITNGTLAIQGTDATYLDQVIHTTQALQHLGCFIVATQDYHPNLHVSFASTHGKQPFETMIIRQKEQILWPDHCVQNTFGSEILIPQAYIDFIQLKGARVDIDSYSGFMDDHRIHTGLHKVLLGRGIDTIVIYGLATDYCVRATAIDGIALGYKVYVVDDLSRGVSEDTTLMAKRTFEDKGVTLVSS